MAIQLGSAYGKIALDASGVAKGVGQAIGSLKNLSAVAMQVGNSMRNIGAAMTLGLTLPIIAFFKSSVDSAMEAESVLAELNAVLKSTGGVAGMTAEELTKMASELQKVTKFSDEQILSGESMLLTFTKIGKDIFPEATEAMLNLAEKFGSVEQASVQLGKALNDPISGVTALRRVGVMLSDEQEKQIKHFMEINDIASAQKVILKELEVEFGGLARAAGETTAGKFAQLKNAFDDLKEVAGEALIPMLLELAKALTKLIEAYMNLSPFQQKMILVFLGLIALMGPVLAFLGTVISAIGGIIGFVTTLGSLGISFGAVAAAVGTAGAAVGAFIVAALPIIAAVLLIVGALALLYWAFKNNIGGISTTVTQLWFIIKYYFTRVVEFIKSIKWSDIGKSIMWGIANGLLLGIPAAILAVIKAAKAIKASLDKELDINSPSGEFKKRGVQSWQGYMQGWNQMDPNAVAQAMARPVLNQSTSSQQNITMQFANGLTMRQAQSMIAENNDQLLKKLNIALGGV